MDSTLEKIILCGGLKTDDDDDDIGTRRKKKEKEKEKIQGTVVLMKKKDLEFNDRVALCLDRVPKIFGKCVSIQLISSTNGDPSNDMKERLSAPATLENWGTKNNLGVKTGDSDSQFIVWFEWDESMGLPGAFLIKNHHHNQFFLKSLTLENVPGYGRVHFACNSWVYPSHCYRSYNRIFFSNKTYLPSQMPEPLVKYRQEELVYLRGDGSLRMLKEWDRVYDYAFYDDLGSPEKGPEYVRPVLGGSEEYPYPRRGLTNRPRNKNDPDTESRLPLKKSLDIYVPRDEEFNHIELTVSLAYAVKSMSQLAKIKAAFDRTSNEFDSFVDVINLYEDLGPKECWNRNNPREFIKWEMLKGLLRSDGGEFLKLPVPDLIKVDKSAWQTDEEFGREMLAGVNPVLIRRVQEFPHASKLDPSLYGNQASTVMREEIEDNMNGLTVDKAIANNKLFILDHHEALMPWLRRINTTGSKIYASRTFLLLQEDGTLKPLAIELSLPHPYGDEHGSTSQVYTPAHNGIDGSIWLFAKAYAAVNDSGYHQLISHWLNTHAVIEPFVIATNRQMSVVHPIYKLLHPHFRDTMKTNALARQILVNAGGILETTTFPAKFSMEMSSFIYKDWVFTDQALPADLLKRGVAVEDPTAPHGLRLLIKDYPYAVDGLEIWFAIESWVREYCSIYYSTDEMVGNDTELQAWWEEIRLVGHGDKQNEPWWPILDTRKSLIQVCTIIIWIASALHAAVNFGQYPYAGYFPNRPTMSRKFMPYPGTEEYMQLESVPERVYLETFTGKFQAIIGVLLIETLSRHSSDEIYLGQRDCSEWTSDSAAIRALERFGVSLMEIQVRIMRRNDDERMKNRNGPVKMPYMLLYPNTMDYSREGGLTGKGIPNSVSI